MVRPFGGGDVQKDSSVPIYSQVERIVMDMIDSGRLSAGQRAPSEREIAETLGISRMTARAAMCNRGLKPGARLLDIGVTDQASEKIYRTLELPVEEDLLRIHRLRTADEEPMCLETSYLPRSYVPWLLEEDFESGSLYRALESHGIELVRAEEHLEATVVRETESELLTVPVGSPALLIERTTYTEGDRPIEYVKSLYRGDRYRFTAMLFKRKARKGGLP